MAEQKRHSSRRRSFEEPRPWWENPLSSRFPSYLEPLKDKEVMASKQADQTKVESAFKANPKNKGTENPWQEIADSVSEQHKIYLPLDLHRAQPRLQL